MNILRESYIDLKVRSGIASADPNCMFLENDIKKAMVLMYIMPVANVISLYCFGMGIGWATDTGMLFSCSLSFDGTYIRTKYCFFCNYVSS